MDKKIEKAMSDILKLAADKGICMLVVAMDEMDNKQSALFGGNTYCDGGETLAYALRLGLDEMGVTTATTTIEESARPAA